MVVRGGGAVTIVAVVNQKGGVAKTTTTANLGALAAAHRRVLILDWDPQAALTASFGLDPDAAPRSVYNAVVENSCALGDVVQEVGAGLWLAPANLDLALAEVQLQTRVARELVLRKALASVAPTFDLVLIDCPPSLGVLVLNALAAAEQVLVPVGTSYLPLRGLRQLLDTVALVQAELNLGLRVHAVVPTLYQRTRHAQASLDALQEAMRDIALVLPPIPRSVHVEEAAALGRPVVLQFPDDRATLAYQVVAERLWPAMVAEASA